MYTYLTLIQFDCEFSEMKFSCPLLGLKCLPNGPSSNITGSLSTLSHSSLADCSRTVSAVVSFLTKNKIITQN